MTKQEPSTQNLSLGLDVGTSGCRGILIDADEALVDQQAVALPSPERHGPRREQEPELWWQALAEVTSELARRHPGRIASIAIDATSGTILLCNPMGRPSSPALMYDDARATSQAGRIAALAPRDSGAHGASSGLAKLLWLLEHSAPTQPTRVLSQADWLSGRLRGCYDLSDQNNALKLGYDPRTQDWPDWLGGLGLPPGLLPEVVAPGTDIGPIDAGTASRLGLPTTTRIVSGTTDSVAAFLATGAETPGEAVTSLGSTLAIKLVSEGPVFAPEYGVYSHRLWDRWLAGGASNTGGAVLRQFFSQAALDRLTPLLRPEEPTGLDYYPLPAAGERFPVADPSLCPRLEPRPNEETRFLQGLLEGIARIELQAYRRLQELGAPFPTSIRTVGGGASNPAWTEIRHRLLGVPMIEPPHSEAAYGAARLARRGIMSAL
ncbi:MAG: FGGY-family carbohydrate kinase [Chromatiales bacterium]